MSALPERQRRMTVVGVWNDDTFPSYLRHFFYTMQLNADSLDLLMINRRTTRESRCLDFEKEGVNITWGGNIKVQCMTDDEWQNRHVDFLCSTEYGWNCNSTERVEVMKEFLEKPNQSEANWKWRPLRGYIVRDLFLNPDNPFWAWIDDDMVLGNFARYPFNVLSQLSIVTGSSTEAYMVYLAGQLTAFNMDDEALKTAWKRFPALKSAAHFTKYLEGRMPSSSEERYWSYGYLRSDEDLPGADLSWCVIPDINGDDYYDSIWDRQDSEQIHIVSGREVLLASTSYTRKEIEALIQVERQAPIDDLGGIGWTGGEDGSANLIAQPPLSSSEAKALAITTDDGLQISTRLHEGLVEDELLLTNCTGRPKWKQCVTPHPLTKTHPPLMRASLVRFKEQKRGHVLRRLEKDQRPRGYERKLLRHHLILKHKPWFKLPPFDITEDLVLRYNSDVIEVFKMVQLERRICFIARMGRRALGECRYF